MKMMKCKHCGKEFTNPKIFRLHEDGCLQAQEENGLIKHEEIDDTQYTAEMLKPLKVSELKEIAKKKGIKGYANMKQDILIAEILKACEPKE